MEPKPSRKLNLKRETLKPLDNHDLDAVNGGDISLSYSRGESNSIQISNIQVSYSQGQSDSISVRWPWR